MQGLRFDDPKKDSIIMMTGSGSQGPKSVHPLELPPPLRNLGRDQT